MARSKSRMTPFSRLLLFMVFIGPLAYIAASYFNGEDGIKNITTTIQKGKDKVSTILSDKEDSATTTTVSSGGGSSSSSIDGSSSSTSSTSVSSSADQTYQIKRLKEQLEELDLENRQLRRTIRELKAELEE